MYKSASLQQSIRRAPQGTLTLCNFALRPLALAIGAASFSVGLTAQAQVTDPAQHLRLEEVIVTAQKRVESLQDVPLSVSAITGEQLEASGIENLSDLTAHMPNLHFTETGFSTQVRVRGIGSDNSQGFEQSVGMYIDGIYYGRAQLFRAPMMDMERAELLRGPQSTLFGKNSIAGALNLTTAKPSSDLTGSVSASKEMNFNTWEMNGMISGPVSDDVRVRIAARGLSDDGYMTNSYLNSDQPQRDESALRLSVDWDASDNLSLYFKAEQSEFDTIGRAIEITYDQPLVGGQPSYADYLQILSQPSIDSELNYERQVDTVETSTNKINNYTLKADYAIGDYSLTAITGKLNFNYHELCDCDFVAADILNVNLYEDYEQFSQEIRLASPVGETVEWLAGVFYQDYTQTFVDQIDILEGSFLTNSAPMMADTGLRRDFIQESTAWALFARATWNVSDEWHITLGARYTEETKDASKVLNIIDPSTSEALNDPVAAYAYLSLFLAESEQARYIPLPNTDQSNWPALENSGHNISGSRDESAFTPLLNIEYDINGDSMAYASFTTGFKAGGFDPRSNSVGYFSAPVGTASGAELNPTLYFEFEEETADAIELGMKNTLLDGRAELNFSLYHTTYQDLQISQFDGGVGFNVGNAKEVLVQGIEVDGRFLVTQNLTVRYGLSLLDFEYKDFKNGNCYPGQTRDGVDLNGDNILDTCDYTGKRGVYTPDHTINLSLDYYRPLDDGWNFIALLDLQQVAEQQVHVNLDPNGEIDPYTMVGLRLGMESENISIAILGKNLLDEEVVSYSGNAPLSDSQFNTNTFYSFVRRPRTIALELKIKF